jgi:hypothetical protein
MRRPVLLFAVALLLLSVAAGTASAVRLPGFRSPSGNIRCLALPGGHAVLCTLAHADYAARLQARCMAPGGAGVDWHGFTLSATGRGMLNCSGGILYPPSRAPLYVVLPYGRSWRLGVFTCWSRSTGVTCRNRSGHGLFVSRQSWRAW